MKIGIITAMSREHSQIAALLEGKIESQIGLFNYTEGGIGANSIVLMQSGIGKVNAAVGALELIHNFAPDVVVSSGVAGGIDPSLAVMDVVASSRIVYHDVWCGEGNEYGQVQGLPAYFESDRTLLKCAMAIESEATIHAGLICSGDKFITDREQLDRIKGDFPDGLAVDMESAAIAQVCYLCETPFLSFRVISDTPGVKDHQTQYENFWGSIADRSFSTVESLLRTLPSTL
ncbi:MAG: 5'-methylthioadenosine/adenosylhomocysteine nucleosidase [Rikenellaceae bacterium]